jgi:four helix bundle protein
MKKESVIQVKSFQFALKIISLYKILQEQREFVISKQLLRSATSVGANVEEATAASSKKDFAYKMSISSREARESKYWLRLLNESQLVEVDLKEYINDVEELIRILTSIVKSSQG